MKNYSIGFERLGIDLNKLSSTGYTTCPSCSPHRKQEHQKSKVLKVYPKTGFYSCVHCDFKGQVDSNEWIEKQHQDSFKEQVSKPMEQPKDKKPFSTAPLPQNALDFLLDRGISKQTAESAKLAYNNGFICFNYYKGNEIVGAKYRKVSEKKFFQHPNCEKYLYGLNDIQGKDEFIIVEGEFDKLAFYEAGIKNCVSVSEGAPNEGSEVGKKLDCLNNSIEYIKNAKRVILACDNDKNGKYLTKVLVERFGADRCATVEFPEDCKDANDVLLKHGKDFLRSLIEKAKNVPIAGVRTLEQAKDKMLDIYENGFKKGESLNIPELEGHFSFYKTWWNLWHGIPNSGKSAYVHFCMLCMSAFKGWKWGVFSPEHYPEEDFYIDMVELLAGRKIAELSKAQFEIAMNFINEHFFFVYPEVDEISNTSTNVLNKIKELKLSKDIDGYLIDPYNQLIREDSDSIDKYLERTLSEVDRLNKTHNLSGNIVAHPRTMYKEKGELDYKKPTPYEIHGGAMWYNKAYCIANIHRPFNQSDKANPMVEIDIQKVKSHKRAGTPTCVTFHFDVFKGWYKSLDGSCALDGFFESLQPFQHQTQTNFRDKLSQNGYNLDECPF